MGSSMSRIYDDYDDYKDLCKLTDKEPVEIRGEKSFYNEMDALYEKYEVQKGNICELFQKVNNDKE